tara:strand:+ start:44 stop:658 length:615 start_codon:yes stop_codon:yes gene_type:complete
MSNKNIEEILNHLSGQDEYLSEIINLTKPVFKKKVIDDEFTSLMKIIIGQQLSGSAANTIVSRVEKTLSTNKFCPKLIIATNEMVFRKCGISHSKIKYIKGIAKLITEQKNYFEQLKELPDDEIIDTLCSLKGVGVWTASIFAMGQLNRKNIFAYGDVTLKKAISIIYGDNIILEKVITQWHPYKTFACRILWQWVDKGMPRRS